MARLSKSILFSVVFLGMAGCASGGHEDLLLWQDTVEFVLENMQAESSASKVNACFVLSVIHSASGGDPAQILGEGEFWGLMGLPRDCGFPDELYLEGLLDPLLNITFGVNRLLESERVLLATATNLNITGISQEPLGDQHLHAGIAALYSAGCTDENAVQYFTGEPIGSHFAGSVMRSREILCESSQPDFAHSDIDYRHADIARLLAVIVSELDTAYRIGSYNQNWKDCSSFAQYVFREGPKITIPRTTSGMVTAFRRDHILVETDRLELSELMTGDLLLMDRTLHSTRYGHVAVVINSSGYIVENRKDAGGVVCHRIEIFPEIYDYVVRFNDIWRLRNE
jgi:cell wall-associated NlpC family hydrolase